MRFNKALVTLSVVLLTVIGCKKSGETTTTGNGNGGGNPIVIAPPPAFGPYVVGYFPSYRDITTVPDVKFRMCNVINYAFAEVTNSGTVTIQNPSVLSAVVTKAKANGAKVMISVFGTETNWQSMANTAAGRNSFIIQMMNIVRQYNLNGVDIDWEFPRTSNGTDITYTALMKELSDSCHRDAKYYLTAALTAGKYVGAVRDAIKDEIFTYVDYVNIMAYDDFNTTVPYKHHSDVTLSNVCLNYWLNTRGAPKNKIVLGIPAYGRPSGITQTGTVLTYNSILGQGANPLSDSAMVTHATLGNYMIYYNGVNTVKLKAQLGLQRGNGVMMWEKGQDSHGSNSLLKAICDTIGRPY